MWQHLSDLCCLMPDVYMVHTWLVRAQSRSLPKVFMRSFCSTESPLWQRLHQNKLFCYILFSRRMPKHLLELYGRSVAMFLAPVSTLVALKVCFKTGAGCISSTKAAKQIHRCKEIKVKNVLWTGIKSDLGRMYFRRTVRLKNLSGETTSDLIEIKDTKPKGAKRRKEENSAFPSTQRACLLLIFLA